MKHNKICKTKLIGHNKNIFISDMRQEFFKKNYKIPVKPFT